MLDFTDIGREEVTKNAKDKAAFKITSLRNIALTPPYMHDGRFSTLEEVVEHYNNGLKASSSLDPALEQTRGTGLTINSTGQNRLGQFLKDVNRHRPNYKPGLRKSILTKNYDKKDTFQMASDGIRYQLQYRLKPWTTVRHQQL